MQRVFRAAILCSLAVLILFSCARTADVPPADVGSSRPSSQQAVPALAEEEPLARYEPPHPLTPEETVKAYFEQQYLSYATLSYTDLSAIADASRRGIKNADVWLQTLILRRRLIAEQGYCFVATEQLPYTVTFEEDPEDERLRRWQTGSSDRFGVNDSAVFLHVRVTGQDGAAYPPMLAVNAQHTFVLFEINGVWKIVFHYYPGSIRRFELGQELTLPDEQQLRDALAREFAQQAGTDPSAPPSGASVYNGVRAAAYAKTHMVTKNRGFYDIGDWMGNCQNFISQCVWTGFSGKQPASITAYDNMTSSWFAGGGGGSPAWENVGHFWDYVTRERKRSSAGLHGNVLAGAVLLAEGDIVQLCTKLPEEGEDEEYHHSLLVVDGDTLMLAQNSPDCFVYYSDLVNTNTRFFRPAYLIES